MTRLVLAVVCLIVSAVAFAEGWSPWVAWVGLAAGTVNAVVFVMRDPGWVRDE